MLALVLLVSGCASSEPATRVGVSGPSAETSERPTLSSADSTSPATALEVEVSRGIDYIKGKSMTVFSPVKAGPWPVVVVYHGIGCEPRTMYDLAEAVAARGAVVFVPAWDALAPSAYELPDVARGWDQAASALAFARANAAEYGGDASRLIAVGHSWGASVAAAMTLAGDRFKPLASKAGVSQLPDACVALDGPMDLRVLVPDDRYASNTAKWNRINPAWIAAHSPAREGVEFRLIVGDWKEGAASNVVFADTLKRAGYTVSLVDLGKGHMEMAEPLDETVSAIMQLANR